MTKTISILLAITFSACTLNSTPEPAPFDPGSCGDIHYTIETSLEQFYGLEACAWQDDSNITCDGVAYGFGLLHGTASPVAMVKKLGTEEPAVYCTCSEGGVHCPIEE